jgi:hypothetical protein
MGLAEGIANLHASLVVMALAEGIANLHASLDVMEFVGVEL